MSHDRPPRPLLEDAQPEDMIGCTRDADGNPEPPGPSMEDESVADRVPRGPERDALRRDPGADADGPP